ncbi:MAG: lysis protein [Pseudomonadales bacterium]|nr:lysis protein [Pseudomonadales bacterium]
MSPATIRGIAILVAVAVIFGAGLLSGRAMVGRTFAEYREDVALDALVDQAHFTVEQNKLNTKLADLSQRHQQEKARAEAAESELLADVQSGARGLSVITNGCEAATPATTGSLDDAAPRTELDPAHAGRIVTITQDGDDGLRALNALQDYVCTVCQPEGAGWSFCGRDGRARVLPGIE